MVLCSTLAVQKWSPAVTLPLNRAPTVADSGVAGATAVVPSGPGTVTAAVAGSVGASAAAWSVVASPAAPSVGAPVAAGAAACAAASGAGAEDEGAGAGAGDDVAAAGAVTVGLPAAVTSEVTLCAPVTTAATVSTESRVRRVGARSRRRG